MGPNLNLIATSGCAEDPAGVPTCTLGNITSGSSQQVSLSVSVGAVAEGTADLDAVVDAATLDDDPQNNTTMLAVPIKALFVDGFESGTTDAWSSVTP